MKRRHPYEWYVAVIVLLVLLIGVLLWWIEDATAQAPQLYMRLPIAHNGYTFTCVDNYPYTDVRPMAFDDETGFGIGSDFVLLEFVVAVEVYNVDMVYRYNPTGELFVWRMTCPVQENGITAIHVNRGAAWITENRSE